MSFSLYDDVEVPKKDPKKQSSIYTTGLAATTRPNSSYVSNPWGKAPENGTVTQPPNTAVAANLAAAAALQLQQAAGNMAANVAAASQNVVNSVVTPAPVPAPTKRKSTDLFDDVLANNSKNEGLNNRGRPLTQLSLSQIPTKTPRQEKPINPDVKKRNSCYIGNLTWWTTDEDLSTSIIGLGVNDILEIAIQEHTRNGQSKGYCSVQFGSELSCKKVILNLPRMQINGKQPDCKVFDDISKNFFELKCKVGSIGSINKRAKEQAAAQAAQAAQVAQAAQAPPAQLPNGELPPGAPQPLNHTGSQPISLAALPNPNSLALPNPINLTATNLPNLPNPNDILPPALNSLPTPAMLAGLGPKGAEVGGGNENKQVQEGQYLGLSKDEFKSIMDSNIGVCNNGISQAYLFGVGRSLIFSDKYFIFSLKDST